MHIPIDPALVVSVKCFAMVGYQRQLPWAKAFRHAAQTEQGGGLNCDEYEKNLARLNLEWHFAKDV